MVNRGYINEQFITEKGYSDIRLENPYILCTSLRLHEMRYLVQFLDTIKSTGRTLVICAVDVDKEVLSTLLFNTVKELIISCPINFPGAQGWNIELIEDVASFTGARTIHNLDELKKLTLGDLGTAKRVTIEQAKTTFYGGAGDTFIRKEQIKTQIQAAELPEEASTLKERLQRLSGKMAVIEIGIGGGHMEINERRDRVVDALNSVRTGLEHGLLPGGATGLFYAGRYLKTLRHNNELDAGIRILSDALMQPLYKLAVNSERGIRTMDELMESQDEDFGLDVISGEIKDLYEAGIVDSAHVVKMALRNAVSLSSMLLSTSAIIYRTKKYEPEKLSSHSKEIF